MKRILVAVTGPDSFGVVYTTSDTLNKLGCSIIDMDQTTVRNEYSAIMIVDKPESVGDDEVAKIIKEALKGKGFDCPSSSVITFRAKLPLPKVNRSF